MRIYKKDVYNHGKYVKVDRERIDRLLPSSFTAEYHASSNPVIPDSIHVFSLGQDEAGNKTAKFSMRLQLFAKTGTSVIHAADERYPLQVGKRETKYICKVLGFGG